MKTNKVSILISKIKGINNAINSIKHSFHEVKESKGNIFESQTKNNLYWIADKLIDNNVSKKLLTKLV